MEDHGATWARAREVAQQCYPDDDLAAEATTRALFDAEETAAYAADLDAQVEEQGVLDIARVAMCLRGELREELRVEGSSAGGIEEEYLHPNDADIDDDSMPTNSPTSSSPLTRKPWSPLPSRGH
jgi:hypothetical protein